MAGMHFLMRPVSLGSNGASCTTETCHPDEIRSACFTCHRPNYYKINNGHATAIKDVQDNRFVVPTDLEMGPSREQSKQEVFRDSWDSLETLSREDITCRLKPEVNS